jgi:hypothetical protein
MTAVAVSSAALVVTGLVFIELEQFALAGFLASLPLCRAVHYRVVGLCRPGHKPT